MMIYFINQFIECCNNFDLKRAETHLFNANVEAQRVLQYKRELQIDPINIGVLF